MQTDDFTSLEYKARIDNARAYLERKRTAKRALRFRATYFVELAACGALAVIGVMMVPLDSVNGAVAIIGAVALAGIMTAREFDND